jgi:hypothetical protein
MRFSRADSLGLSVASSLGRLTGTLRDGIPIVFCFSVPHELGRKVGQW